MAKSKTTLRVHNLAKELGVESRAIIAKCATEGIELKNHMAAISPGLAESIREWFSVGDDITSVEVGERVDLTKVLKPRRSTRSKSHGAQTNDDHVDSDSAVATEVEEEDRSQEEVLGAAILEKEADDSVAEDSAAPEVMAAALPETVDEVAPEVDKIIESPTSEIAPREPQPAESQPELPPVKSVPAIAARQVEPPPPPATEPVRPMGPQLVPKPAELQGPRVIRIEAPERVAPPRPRPRSGPGPAAPVGAPRAPGSRDPLPLPPAPASGRKKRGRGSSEEEEAAKARARSPRRHGDVSEVDAREREWRDQDLIERRERLASATGQGLQNRRAAERRRRAQPGQAPSPARKGAIEIEVPMTLKEFCSAVGTPFAVLFKHLSSHTGRPWTINETLDAETAEFLAVELGIDLHVTQGRSPLETLEDEFASRERPNLEFRPPVVAMLGHVDHGKTSLLDAIRKTNVAAGEAGGITQHIGAYRIDRGDWHVTFLDTPGHEAFTAMRARGADLTDVVVLVVAADDGVMPQTIEAINHAKAAGVEIVIALNKIDMPGVDLNRIYAQLAEHELVPAEWGGETDVLKTSATKGTGVDELIAHLSQLSELMELKADPSVPAFGSVIEAQMREGQGVVADVLVREGTLRVGQFIVCGPGAGKIRLLRDDRGKRVESAGPGTPIEVTGLDELPSAGDKLFVVESLARAKEIATDVRNRRRAEALRSVQAPKTMLEDLIRQGDAADAPELGVILKADVQGSLDALKSELDKIPSDKVKLVIKHSGVGAVTEADVDLAHVSKALVLGFYVIADDRARRRADELGVEIRSYRVIYEIVQDVQKALAGLLAPLQKHEARGKAEVRRVFNVSRFGTIAGCIVSDGVVARNHKARLVRDGRIVVEGAALESLKRFKDDAREVRAGLECGIKLANYDDVKPGDVIETYEVVEVAQQL